MGYTSFMVSVRLKVGQLMCWPAVSVVVVVVVDKQLLVLVEVVEVLLAQPEIQQKHVNPNLANQ